jgi:hypothetical protein
MMTRRHWFFALLLASVSITADCLPHAAVPVTMCDLYSNPQRYLGKMVKLRATIAGYKDPTLEQPSFSPQQQCPAGSYMIIAFELPKRVDSKAGLGVVENLSFTKYRDAIRRGDKVEATIEGIFNAAFVWENQKRIRIGEGNGYGKNHSADGNLVLHEISDVSTRPRPRK